MRNPCLAMTVSLAPHRPAVCDSSSIPFVLGYTLVVTATPLGRYSLMEGPP